MKRTKLVLDTNILIYGINEESRYFEEINRVMENPRYQFFITCKQISEFICVLSKLGRYDAVENELPLILNKFKVIFSNKRSTRIFQELINKYKPVGNKVFDIEIVSIMLSKNIKNLYSINIRDFNHIEEIRLIENLAF